MKIILVLRKDELNQFRAEVNMRFMILVGDMMGYHLGMVVALANGEYSVDEYGNVFFGKSWAGRGDINEIIINMLRILTRKYGNILIEDVDRKLVVVDGCLLEYSHRGIKIIFDPERGILI